MSLRSISRSAIQVGAAAGAVYGLRAGLRRMEERTQNADLGKGHRFLILGGGFAGAAVAQELARLLPGPDNGEILLIDEDNYLLFTPMLTEAAGGELAPWEIVSPARLLSRRITFIQGRATKIDLAAKSVEIETKFGILTPTPRTESGDHLILALGSVVNFHQTPGVAENSIPMKRLDDAAHALQHVSACLELAVAEVDADTRRQLLTFVVAGGGFTGVETMAAINDLVRSRAEQLYTIEAKEIRTIVVHPGDRLLPELTPELAAYATEKLQQHGVEVRLNARIAGAGADFVEVEGGERIPARIMKF